MQFLRENKILIWCSVLFVTLLLYFDKPVAIWVRTMHDRKSAMFVRYFDIPLYFLTHGSTLVIIACLFLVAGLFLGRRFIETGKALSASFLVSGIAAQVLKHLIGRARPRLTDDVIFIGPTLRGGYDSFPSGHTTVGFCFAYTLSQYFPKYRGVFYFLATVIGISRIESTSHFSSDVVAGAAVGLILGRLLSQKLSFMRDNSAVVPEKRTEGF
jgi:membrane-associated phospholipid phosphatase